MNDDRINDDDAGQYFEDNDQNNRDADGHLTDDELRNIIDVRDRLTRPSFPDEPLRPEFGAYQRLLDEVYKLPEFDEFLRVSLYQIVRTEYLIGEYYKRRNQLGEAANHFARAAEAANQVPDWILYAQLKYLESKACSGVDPKQFRRAFATAVDALDSWRRLAPRDVTADIHYEFKLADNVGGTAVCVAEDDVAMNAYERAGVLLQRLHGRIDVNTQQYANDDLFLTWNWVAVYVLKGNFRQAFKHILQTRKKDHDLLEPINRDRLHWFIAFIAMGCAEQGSVEDYTYGRLLAAAGRAIDEAYSLTKKCKDRAGYALTLLADAKLMGMLRKFKEERIGKIAEAQSIAADLNDLVLLGQVDVAWGDEYAFQGMAHPAERFYRKAVHDMTQIEFLQLARMAEHRLERLLNPPPPQISPGNPGGSGSSPKKPNDPPPDDIIPLN